MKYFEFDKDDPHDLTSQELETIAESVKGFANGLLCALGIMSATLGLVYILVTGVKS